MTVRVAKITYWTCLALAALVVVLGVLDTVFAGPGGALLFYLTIAATLYLVVTWVFQRGRHA
jgi:hypothetical protein